MIYYLSPGNPKTTISGGTRKLYDHVSILNAHGIEAQIVHTPGPEFDRIARRRAVQRQAPRRGAPRTVTRRWFNPDEDFVVIPEVYGDGIRDFIPEGWRRIVFVQNGFLTGTHVDGTQIIADMDRHPYLTTPDLIAIFTESDLTTWLLNETLPDIAVPIIRTHSSGNGRNGETAGFTYGQWPRSRRIVYFQYKHEADNKAIFDDLPLPDGWEVVCMTGMTDAEIAEQYRTAAVFMAANTFEGMCAPTSEAMISGCAIVCWTGQGPDEYLRSPEGDRAWIAPQDDVEALRERVCHVARLVDSAAPYPPSIRGRTPRHWSDWFQTAYSRQREIDELLDIWKTLIDGGTP